MNGVHDLGGMHGFGAIDPEPEDVEPVFHAPWEGRIFALAQASAALGRWSVDASRHARERLDAVTYLRASYFEKWVISLEMLLVEHGVVTGAELASGRPTAPAPDTLTARRLTAQAVAERTVKMGAGFQLEAAAAPRFAPGDRIRVRPVTTPGHTRAVGYARGRFGVVTAHRGCHVFPDRSAQGERTGEHLYNVAFGARELWGGAATDNDRIHIDLWEPYLEAVP